MLQLLMSLQRYVLFYTLSDIIQDVYSNCSMTDNDMCRLGVIYIYNGIYKMYMLQQSMATIESTQKYIFTRVP